MAERLLQLTVDTTQANVNLDALGRTLDRVSASSSNFAKNIASGLSGADRNLSKVAEATKKFGVAAQAMNGIKLDPQMPNRVLAFAKAMEAVATTKSVSRSQVSNLDQFVKSIAKMKAPPTGLNRLVGLLDGLSRAKMPTAAQANNLKNFFAVLGSVGSSAASPRQIQSVTALAHALTALSNVNPPSQAKIARIKMLFDTLASLKQIPNAPAIARSLSTIGTAAQRASNGFAGLPPRIVQSGEAARRSGPHLVRLGGDLNHLSARFSLAYQSGTLFGTLFSAFTIGTFVRKLYSANIELMKLQKGLIFATGSFDKANESSDRLIGTATDLGLDLGKTVEAYSRFVISARASGIEIDKSDKIFRSISTALQVVGANSEQSELAFYGLTQMMQKGKVVSEEFNRQIGEQLPGNAVFGAQALSKLRGEFVSVGQLFKEMSLGKIMSAEFVPVWADIIGKAFEPLMNVARQRPDLALNQLKNAFFVFAREIGRGGFMGSLTKEFNRIRDAIITVDGGVAHLTPQAEKLARVIGAGLSSVVHHTGDALRWLANNLDKVVTVAKVVAGLLFVSGFMKWTRYVVDAVGSVAQMGKGIREWTKAQLGLNAAIAAQGKSSKFAQTEQTAAALGPLAFGKAKTVIRTAAPMENAASFAGSAVLGGGLAAQRAETVEQWAAKLPMGTPASAYAVTAGGMAMGARQGQTLKVGFETAAGGAAALAVTAKKADAPLQALMKTFKFLGPAARVAASGLMALQAPMILIGGWIGIMALFSDKATEASNSIDRLGRKHTTLGDELAVGLGALASDMGRAFGGPPEGYEINWQSFFDFLGQNFLGLISYIETFASMIYHIPGDALATVHAVQLNMSGRSKEAAAITAGIDSHYDPNNPQKFYDKLASDAAARTAKRTGPAAEDAAYSEEQRRAADQIAALQAASDALTAQGQMADIQRRASMANFDIPEWDKLKQTLADADKMATDAAKVAANAAKTSVTADTMQQQNNGFGGDKGVQLGSVVGVNASAAAAKMSADVAEAIRGAAAATGISEAFLKNLIYQESKFNPKAGAGTTSAVGLGQFVLATGEKYGLVNTKTGYDQRTNPMLSAIATARYAADNAKILQGALGRSVSGGELYAAHFLGPGTSRDAQGNPTGAIKFLRALSANPNILGINAVSRDTAANNASVFYKDPKTKRSPKTVAEVMAFFNDVAGGKGMAITGSPMAPASPQQVAETERKLAELREKVNSLRNGISPDQAALGEDESTRLKISEIAQTREDLRTQGVNVDQIFKPGELEAIQAASARKVADATNPFAKDARSMKEANDVLAMRLRGMNDEADFQQKLNELMEQGYDVTKLNIQSNRDLVAAEKMRERVLQSQIDLTKALNDAQISQIHRTGSPLQGMIADRLKIEDGQTFDQAMAQARKDGTLGNITKAAGADLTEQQAAATQNLRETLDELTANSRLNSVAAQWRDDYKGYLQDLTKSSHESLAAIEGDATEAQKAFAANAASIKQAIDNPPGFEKWVKGLEPVANRLEDIKTKFMEDLSNGLTDALMGENVDWTSLLKGLQRDMTKIMVDNMLAGLLKGFGVMKPEDVAVQKQTDAAAASQAAAENTSGAAHSLTDSATNLNTAATSLNTAANALANGTGASGGVGGALGSAGGGGGLMSTIQSAMAMTSPDIVSTNDLLPSMASLAGLTQPHLTPQSDGSFLSDAITVMGQRPGGVSTSDLVHPPADMFAGLTHFAEPHLDGAGAGGMGKMGQFGAMAALTLLPMALSALFKKKKKKEDPTQTVHGIIGQMGTIDVSGTAIPGHANPIATALNTLVGLGMQTFGVPGFAEGGLSTMPVGRLHSMPSWRWAGAPHYAEGTHNTSGIPAVLHPNEAVIPLSRGRKIPVEMGGHSQNVIVHAPMTVVTPDADSFRASRNSIERKQSGALRRAAARNLTA